MSKEDDLVYLCALNMVFYNSPKTGHAITDSFENPADFFSLPHNALKELFGKKTGYIEKLSCAELLDDAYKEVKWAEEKGVRLLSPGNDDYPQRLASCGDAPLMLYVAGDADFNDSGSVSVVGTRLASSYGRETCRKIISHLKESGCDPSIVSGLAYGIDVCAHRAALDSGLRTIGVLPCGIDRIYPSRHRNIAAEMTVRGAVVTEFPRGTGVTRYGFIKRNRIIAGMSEAVIVVETRIKGGSMNTVEYALSYGRDVFAVPGRISDVNSYGCNYLISKNMAAIYCSRETVPAALGWKKEYISEASLQNDIFSFDESKKEKILLTLTSASSSDMDSIMLATGLGFEEASALMLELEMEGRIRENGDNEYYLADD